MSFIKHLTDCSNRMNIDVYEEILEAEPEHLDDFMCQFVVTYPAFKDLSGPEFELMIQHYYDDFVAIINKRALEVGLTYQWTTECANTYEVVA